MQKLKKKEELKSLSRAYSEVLGLKKYDDLKQGLKSLISSLKEGVNDVDQNKLDELINQQTLLNNEIEFVEEKLTDIESQIDNKIKKR